MASSTIAVTNFTAGEVSPRFDGRVDMDKYFNACSTLENMTVFPLGGAEKRPGFEFINEVKDSTKATRLIPFEFSVEQAYVLEFGETYVRIYLNGEILESGGSPVELTTPYLESELFDIQFTQSADILFVVHPNHAPAEISRTGATTWTYAATSFTNPPSVWTGTNYPSTVTFFQQRLCYAGTPNEPQTIWMSKTADFRVFTAGTDADSPITITLDSDQVNAIRWMVSGRLLSVGTAGGEWTVGGTNVGQSITPDNIQAQRQSTLGSTNVLAILVSSAIIYIERGGRKVREFAYLFDQDGYQSPDMTLLAEHLGRDGMFIEIAYAKRPDSIFWMIRDDGVLVGMTYQREEGVVAMHRHTTEGIFESVATIPGASDSEVWVIVKRNIDGSDVRYIERLAPRFESTTTNTTSCTFLDSFKVVDEVSPTDTFSGFDHLIGESVSVLADGATHPDVTVNGSGEIVLDLEASILCAGFMYDSIVSPMRLEGGSPGGISQTKKSRISRVAIRFYKTLGAEFGGRLDKLDRIPFRDSSDPMDEAPALFTGTKDVLFPQGWNRDRFVYVKQSQPLPLTVLMMVSYVTVNR